MTKLVLVGVALLITSAALALAPLGGRGVIAAAQNVSVTDDAFVDSTSNGITTTITAGDAVHWTWSGTNTHSVTADDGSFDHPAGSFQTSGTFDMTFSTPGTYAYYCRIHGGPGGIGMHGVVVVAAAAPAPTDTTIVATNTPIPASATSTQTATNTAVAATTPASTSTPALNTPVATSPAATATQAAAVAGASALPGTGDGPSATGYPWLSTVLAAFGASLLGAAAFGAALIRR